VAFFTSFDSADNRKGLDPGVMPIPGCSGGRAPWNLGGESRSLDGVHTPCYERQRVPCGSSGGTG
jgi:hypothetical protein